MLTCPKCGTGWEFGAPFFKCPDCQEQLIEMEWDGPSDADYVVEFEGGQLGACHEAVIRSGASLEDLVSDDVLGCKAVRVRPLEQVRVRPFMWDKDGELRCELE